MPRVDLVCVLVSLASGRPSIIRTGGSSGRNDSTVETSLGDHVNLYSWITARIIDRTGVNLRDRHFVLSSSSRFISLENLKTALDEQLMKVELFMGVRSETHS